MARSNARAVALLEVAIVLTGCGASTTPTSSASPVDEPLPSVLTVWPENPVRGPSPAEVQAQLDGGDASLEWRLHPEIVARRFAQQILGWDDAVAVALLTDPPLASGRMFAVHPCIDEGCPGSDDVEFVVVDQVAGGGEAAIWSVLRAKGTGLDVGSEAEVKGSALELGYGSSLPVTFDVGPDERVQAGAVVQDGCSDSFSLEPDLTGPSFDLPTPKASDDQPNCGSRAAGYAFAYSTSSIEEATGDPLLEPGDVLAVTIVPVFAEVRPP
jgi:hypothetical protein